MIILVGGISCTGKTLMSQTLLEKYKAPYFSIDHLKMGLYLGDDNCGFTPMDSNELIGEKLWPIIKGMITVAIENKQNMIIEGCYLLPHLIKDFEKEYLDQIIPVFLGFSTDYIKENFVSGIIEHRSAIELRECDEERPMTQFIDEHADLKKQCVEHGADHFEIQCDYEEEIQKVYKYIDNRINQLSKEE